MGDYINKGKRLAYLDAIKCLGILLVINGHVQLYGMNISVYDSIPSLMLYTFNMPLFFFISGYLVFKENSIGKASELKKIGSKFLFLVLPAFIFYSIYVIKQGGAILDFIKHGFGGYWFTFSLFEMFLIYYLVNYISKTRVTLFTILIILSILGVCYLSVFSEYEVPCIDFNHLAKYFQFFTLGVLAKMFETHYDRIMKSEILKALSLLSYFLLLFSIYQINMPPIIFQFIRDIVLRYLGLFIVVSFFYCNQQVFNKENKLNNLILKIGQNSLAIYFLQYFFMPNFSDFQFGADLLTRYAVSFLYTIFITTLCMTFIELLSNSVFVKKYVLGNK